MMAPLSCGPNKVCQAKGACVQVCVCVCNAWLSHFVSGFVMWWCVMRDVCDACCG